MGRQINFFQLESDIHDMLIFLNQHHVSVFDSNGNILTKIKDIYNQQMVAINEKYIPKKIGIANSPVEYIVPCSLDTAKITEARFYIYNSSNYEVKKTEGMRIIKRGRFYLSNEYYHNDTIVTIYNLLKNYIRKNYVYSKERWSYFSPKFIEEYKNGNVYAADGTNVYPVTDV